MADYDHGVLLKNLYDKIVAVTAFANITGTNVGGMVPDPTLITLTPPACWVMFAGDGPKEQMEQVSLVPAIETIYFMFNAFIYLPMSKQNDMITIHLPLLKAIIAGVRGKESSTGHRWAYAGQRLALINANRLVFAQRYTVTGVM